MVTAARDFAKDHRRQLVRRIDLLADATSSIPRTRKAAFEGTCGDCGSPIARRQVITYTIKGWCHIKCTAGSIHDRLAARRAARQELDAR